MMRIESREKQMRDDAEGRDCQLVESLDEIDQCTREWWTQEANGEMRSYFVRYLLWLKMLDVAMMNHLYQDLTDQIIQ